MILSRGSLARFSSRWSSAPRLTSTKAKDPGPETSDFRHDSSADHLEEHSCERTLDLEEHSEQLQAQNRTSSIIKPRPNMTSSPIHRAYFTHQSASDVISLTSNCIKERQQRLRPLDGDEPDDKDTKGELVSAQSWRRATPWETGLGMYSSWITSPAYGCMLRPSPLTARTITPKPRRPQTSSHVVSPSSTL